MARSQNTVRRRRRRANHRLTDFARDVTVSTPSASSGAAPSFPLPDGDETVHHRARRRRMTGELTVAPKCIGAPPGFSAPPKRALLQLAFGTMSGSLVITWAPLHNHGGDWSQDFSYFSRPHEDHGSTAEQMNEAARAEGACHWDGVSCDLVHREPEPTRFFNPCPVVLEYKSPQPVASRVSQLEAVANDGYGIVPINNTCAVLQLEFSLQGLTRPWNATTQSRNSTTRVADA